jgi:hypothetical protein
LASDRASWTALARIFFFTDGQREAKKRKVCCFVVRWSFFLALAIAINGHPVKAGKELREKGRNVDLGKNPLNTLRCAPFIEYLER